jgi:DNA-repair protein complementing XP-A cells
MFPELPAMPEIERPRTPPPRPVPSLDVQLTPEQVKRIEINRLKGGGLDLIPGPNRSTDHIVQAKAKQRQREQAASTSSSIQHNANNKRPISVIPANSTSPTAPKPPPKLRPDARLGKYFDYDLSKMVNSKGGFLVEDGQEIDEDSRIKARERERQRAMQNLEPRMSICSFATHNTHGIEAMFLDPNLNPKCKECQSMDIDQTFKKVFGCLVCNKCKNEQAEKYSLLTKTECKEVRLYAPESGS